MNVDNKRILITGASGMLGTALIDFLNLKYSVFATDLVTGYSPEGVVWKIFDLQDHAVVSDWLTDIRPDIIIHCAALVNVDFCEKHKELAYSIHAGVTEKLFNYANQTRSKLIYISTDSVFDGKKKGAYVESDSVNPLNVYAKTKREGELVTLASDKNVVLRTNIFGWNRDDKISFAEWILKGLVLKETLTMFRDVMYTPIHVFHLAEIVHKIIAQNLTGLFHATGSTVLSKYEFAILLAGQFNLSIENIEPTDIEKAGLAAVRPQNMVLDNSLLCKSLDWQIPKVENGIYLQKTLYENGWLSLIKDRKVKSEYRFWEV